MVSNRYALYTGESSFIYLLLGGDWSVRISGTPNATGNEFIVR
jgi:hypothetical protein